MTEAFIKNGMRHALLSLGHGAAANADKWEYEVVVNQRLQQVMLWNAMVRYDVLLAQLSLNRKTKVALTMPGHSFGCWAARRWKCS